MNLFRPSVPFRPIFVGGTGRSGTTITAKLIAAHDEVFQTTPREVRFISLPKGVLDALSDKCSPETTAENILGPWFMRKKNSEYPVGLFQVISDQELRSLTNRYLEEFKSDRWSSSRALVESIISNGKSLDEPKRWVDSTPQNALRSSELLRLFPDARIVHVMRDGRDVAASFVKKNFGPDDPLEALGLWHQRLIKAHEAQLGADTRSILKINLADLVTQQRVATLERLMKFLDLDLSQDVIEWFESEVTLESAHVGRWSDEFSDRISRELNSRYEKMLTELVPLGAYLPANAE